MYDTISRHSWPYSCQIAWHAALAVIQRPGNGWPLPFLEIMNPPFLPPRHLMCSFIRLPFPEACHTLHPPSPQEFHCCRPSPQAGLWNRSIYDLIDGSAFFPQPHVVELFVPIFATPSHHCAHKNETVLHFSCHTSRIGTAAHSAQLIDGMSETICPFCSSDLLLLERPTITSLLKALYTEEKTLII